VYCCKIVRAEVLDYMLGGILLCVQLKVRELKPFVQKITLTRIKGEQGCSELSCDL
jgi:hypothetical protein